MRVIEQDLIEQLRLDAEKSPRLRSHCLLHSNHDEVVQRLLIGFVKGSFVEPHYHALAHQWEMFAVLHGVLEVKVYDDCGNVTKQFNVGNDMRLPNLIEFSPNDTHSIKCLSDFALLLEVKEGPFDPKHAKSTPSWL